MPRKCNVVVGTKPQNDLPSDLLGNTPVDAQTCPIFILLIPLSQKDILYQVLLVTSKKYLHLLSFNHKKDFKLEYQSLKKKVI
jgi:hypothetical protein